MKIPALKPAPTLGILGGGQLAKMTAQAATQFGCEVVILERQPEFPAHSLDTQTIIGDWDDPRCLLELARRVDIVTLENEFVEAAALEVLERHGYSLQPRAAVIRTVQDKLTQKQELRAAGLPVTEFMPVDSIDDLLEAGRQMRWPLVLKKRRNSYDGKGNATVKDAGEAQAAWARLDGDRNALYAEQWCAFELELAVIVVRARDGQIATYPVVETVNRNHICHLVKAPAAVDLEVSRLASHFARKSVTTLEGIGAFGIEFFLLRDGTLLINEIAPRVHNTGHYTIEACECSQFENHVRALVGWPLGSTAMQAAGAAMVNLLGVGAGSGRPSGLEEALAVRGAHVHVYGKLNSQRDRKMGHVTALGATVAEAQAAAERAASLIRFGAPSE